MHYWIFPLKDATIYDDSPDQNTGLDQIIELQKQLVHAVGDFPFNSRILIQFDISDFSSSMATSQNSGSNMKWYLNLYTDEAIEIPLAYTIEVYPLSSSWEMGNGKRADLPITTTGVSWNIRDGLSIAGISGSSWVNAGGDWISGSSKNVNQYMATQSFDYQTTDVHVDVTETVNAWLQSSDTGSLANYGFIVKRTHTDETSSLNQGNLQFFSKDTHTIYRPRLEAVWIDSTINPYIETVVSTSYTEITSSDFVYRSPVLYYTTQSFYTASIGTGSYFTQSGDTNTWYSESYSWMTSSIYSYTGSIGLYHSSSYVVSSVTTSSPYTSGSDIIYPISSSTSTISNFYTASLGSEYKSGSEPVNVYFSTGSVTSSDDVWTYVVTGGYYFSESFSSVTANYTYVSSSITGYATASLSTSTQVVWPVGSEDFVIYLTNLKESYRQNSRIRFRVGTREKYPRKTFVTQSWAYTQDQFTLPLTSYYSLRDSWDEYEWIPFSDYTKLSIDATGSYFDVDLNGFEPERFYRILFKVIQKSGSVDEIERVIDKDYSFKVIR